MSALTVDVHRVPLSRLSHDDLEKGVTLVELVGLLAGEPRESFPPRTLP